MQKVLTIFWSLCQKLWSHLTHRDRTLISISTTITGMRAVLDSIDIIESRTMSDIEFVTTVNGILSLGTTVKCGYPDNRVKVYQNQIVIEHDLLNQNGELMGHAVLLGNVSFHSPGRYVRDALPMLISFSDDVYYISKHLPKRKDPQLCK